MILVIFFQIMDKFLIHVCIFLGKGMVKCASLLAPAHLHCDHEQIHDKQKIEKKLGLLGFGSHSDLKYL